MFVRTLPIALALLAGAVACGETPSDVPVGQGEYRWGLLNEDSLVPEAPQYLVNKTRGATYRVCLPRYMSAALPGIESEIFASINVWGAYLGRTTKVEIVTKDLPRSRADQSVDDLAAAYQETCGADFDVVMGLAKIEGAAVGLTGSSFEFFPQPNGTRHITAFSRFLFLRDYDLVKTVDGDVPERWTSLAAQDGVSTSGPDLLAKMLARASTRYAVAGTYLLLPVLTHEYGHVWGLCDQYEGSANCDPVSSTTHRVEASIMGARGATQRLYLTDDDVQGIRVLGGKAGFAHDWGPPRADAPAPVALKPVELARIESVRRGEGNTLVVKYGVVTPGAARYAFALQEAGAAEFTPLTGDFNSATAVDVPVGRLTITLGGPSTKPFKVRLIVTPATGASATVVAAEQ